MNDLGSIPEATIRLEANPAGITEAARLIRAGDVVAFPTETVYGLGADATDPAAVARIFAAKQRPRFNPLIAHLWDVEAALREGVFDADAARLATRFWPGPLTLVVPAGEGSVCDLARAGLPSVALRVPSDPTARALLAEVGRPVAAPSANRSGRVSPTNADHVRADLDGRIAAILDGGPAPVGVESTVVACLGGAPRLLRPGGVTQADLCACLGRELDGPPTSSDNPIGPGLLASHYAPRAMVRLDAHRIEPGEAALLFGSDDLPGLDMAVARFDLSRSGDLAEAAARLFSALRWLDEAGAAVIAVAPISKIGLGEAINDRLRRAAAPR